MVLLRKGYSTPLSTIALANPWHCVEACVLYDPAYDNLAYFGPPGSAADADVGLGILAQLGTGPGDF